VTVRVDVERIHPGAAERAAAAAVTGTFGLLAPRRDVVVLMVQWANGPGTAVAPWTLAGLRAAAREQDLRWREIRIAACGTTDDALGLGRFVDDDGRRVGVELPGSHRARRVPSTWFGAHLCLVVPCVHVRKNGRGGAGPVWLGPGDQALRALDRACQGPPGRESANVGARVATTVFASATIVIDASWWAPMQPDDAGPPSLLALDRCLALGTVSPSSAWRRHVLGALDPWLAANLRLGPMPAGDGSVAAAGSAASTPWPRAPSKVGAPPRSLATEAVAALWKAGRPRPRRVAPERRLGPAVPGDLARLWHAFDSPCVRTPVVGMGVHDR
jgi:hypothetical protein